MIKNNIREIVSAYIAEKKWDVSGWLVENPKDKNIADYSVNIAFKLAGQLKKSPMVIAEEVSDEIRGLVEASLPGAFEVFALRGFVNFKLTPAYCFHYISDDSFSKNLVAEQKKYLLEYVSANPTGPLHIGHGRWAALGDTLKRILQHVGHEVATEFYVNDAGNQINNLMASIEARKNGADLPADGYAGEYVKDLVDSDEPLVDIRNQQKSVLASFGVEFDTWFSEKNELHKNNLVAEAIEFMKSKKLAYESDGALFFRSTDFGDDKDRVLIKADGSYTYFAADIAYHKNKVDRGYSDLINIWGADHHGYIKRVKSALHSLFGDEVVLDVLLGQLVFLFRDGEEVRMSKRTGEMITLEEVIEDIGSDACRFFLVSKPADTAVDFDLELAKKQTSDNPVFYIQYAHARISSILRKAEVTPVFQDNVKIEEIEHKLLRFLVYFEDELMLVARNKEPHRIANYLVDLANMFHSFYHQCKVNTDDEALTANRLAIIASVRKILATGLDLLGISAPEKM